MDSGTRMLVQMAGARRFNRWMADTIAPFIKGAILEAGAGIGNLTEFLFRPGTHYIATELEDDHLEYLHHRFASLPGLTITKCDLEKPSDLCSYEGTMDTVICLNVLEHIKDDHSVLRNLHSCLKCSGRAVILVPQGPRAYGSMDRVLDHYRRYTELELQSKLETAGFRLEQMILFNRITYPGWILNSRVLCRKKLSTTQLHFVDFFVPLWRRIDRFLPWPPTSLIAIATRVAC